MLDPQARKGFNPETVDRCKVKNHQWAKLLMRMFRVDVGACPACGTQMEIRGALHHPVGIARYLKHLGLAAHPPPVAVARREAPSLGFDEAQESPSYP